MQEDTVWIALWSGSFWWRQVLERALAMGQDRATIETFPILAVRCSRHDSEMVRWLAQSTQFDILGEVGPPTYE